MALEPIGTDRTWSEGSLFARRSGRMVVIRMRGVPANTSGIVLPEEYRPMEDCTFSVQRGNIGIRTSGTIEFGMGDFSGNVWHTMFYFAK